MDINAKKAELGQKSVELEQELMKLASDATTKVADKMQAALKLMLVYRQLLTVEAVESGKESIDKLNELLPTGDEVMSVLSDSVGDFLDKGSEFLSGLSERLREAGKKK